MVIKDLMNMKNVRLLGATISSVFLLFSVSIPANAATYTITFYERIGSLSILNLFNTDHYIVSGTGSFEINDTAVTPNNLVLFTDSNFLAFDAIISSTGGGGRFTLGTDDNFPPFDANGLPAQRHEQGILFDASGQPLRFDNPSTFFSNSANIRSEENLDFGGLAKLTLWDANAFDTVFLNDGTITSGTLATANGQAFTRLSGEWGFIADAFPQTGTASDSWYLIQAVPVPAAVWLFGSGLLGLIGIARRKRV